MKKVAVVLILLWLALMTGTPGFAQNPLQVGVNASVLYPSGDLADLAKLGFNGGLTVKYFIMHNIALTGGVNYSMFGEKVILIFPGYRIGNTYWSPVEEKIAGAYLPITVGLDYNLATIGEMTPYVSCTVGYYLGMGDFKNTVFPSPTIKGLPAAKAEELIKRIKLPGGNNYGVIPGAGFFYDFGNYKIDFTMTFHYIASDPAAMYIGVNSGFIFDLIK